MKSYIFTIFFVFTFSSIASAKSKNIKLVGNDVSTSVVGSFQKADGGFIYLKVKGAKQLVRIPQKYSLNHPSNYNKGLVLKMDLPLSVYMSSNLRAASKSSKYQK